MLEIDQFASPSPFPAILTSSQCTSAAGAAGHWQYIENALVSELIGGKKYDVIDTNRNVEFEMLLVLYSVQVLYLHRYHLLLILATCTGYR